MQIGIFDASQSINLVTYFLAYYMRVQHIFLCVSVCVCCIPLFSESLSHEEKDTSLYVPAVSR